MIAGGPEASDDPAVSDAECAALRYHGDAALAAGLLDFAVNVQGAGPPDWLRDVLACQLGDLGRYPSADQDRAAREVVARRHGRSPAEVLPVNGAAEAFALLGRLQPRLAAVVHPSFTEPELLLRQAGIIVERILLPKPFALADAEIPEAADLVVLGNPTNPTSVLHPAAAIHALRRPGRLIVVDEAFADAVPGESESVAGERAADVLVVRSLTKTWSLAGLRCGYLLGAPEVLARLTRGRPPWPVNTLALTALVETATPRALAEVADRAWSIAADRTAMINRLTELGIAVHTPAAAPFVLVEMHDGERVRVGLRRRGVAVRRCDTFPGLGADWLRFAVRPPGQVDQLATALRDIDLEKGSRG